VAKYLASFCNNARARLALVSDLGIERSIDLDLSMLGRDVNGLIGVTFHQSHCVVGVQCFPSAMVVLDRAFRVRKWYDLEDVNDLHGIASFGGEIIAVSSGTNQVMAFDPRTRTLRVIWASSESLSDTLHLNDVTVRDKAVFCSRFGARGAQAARNGDVFDVITGERAVSHLREPHSVFADGNDLFVLESATGDLLRSRPGIAPRRICGIQGYPRGLAINSEHYVIGKSGYRHVSRHRLGDSRQAPLTHSAAAEAALLESGIYFVDRATLAARFIDTTSLGHEIYQILELPRDFVVEATPPAAVEAEPGGGMAVAVRRAEGSVPEGEDDRQAPVNG
jgi:hypothetical protein